MRTRDLAVYLLVSTNIAQASPYSFGGACESRGAWTVRALNISQGLASYLATLRDDPNCHGIEGALLGLQGAADNAEKAFVNLSDYTDAEEYLSFPEKMRTFRELLNTDNSQPVLKQIFDMSLDANRVSQLESLQAGTTRAVDEGLGLLNHVWTTLPKYQRCLDSNPSQALAILGATLHLTNAFISSGEGFFARIGNSLASFLGFIRQFKFERRLRELGRTEYLTSLACVMETTSTSYCETSNTLDMLETIDLDNEIREGLDSQRSYNPLEGYFLMQRELNIISEWLQAVMYGVDPRTPMDASFKETVQDNVNDMVKSRYALLGIYNYEVNLLQGLTLKQSQQNHIIQLLGNLVAILTSERGNINFYRKAMMPERIPFYLIGRQEAPRETLVPSAQNPVPIPWDRYMKTKGENGSFIEEFDDPSALAEIIGERLKNLIARALVNASDYFRQQLIIDMGNLIARSLTSQTISVFQSLENIRDYLERMSKEIMAGYGEKAILRNVLDTVDKVDFILEGFYESREIVNEYIEKSVGLDFEARKKLILENKKVEEIYSEILTRVYSSFNILYQRDTFLVTRMRTFVQNDYAYKTQHMDELTEHQRIILTLTGKQLLERLQMAYDMNPTLMRRDLENAQFINLNTINVVQRSFDDRLFAYLLELKLIDEGNYSALNGNLAAMNQLVQDSLYRSRFHNGRLEYAWDLGMPLKLIHNLIWNRDRYDAPSLFDFEHGQRWDSSHSSIRNLRAKLCIQSLMFRNAPIFERLCRGIVLRSEIALGEDARQRRLEVSYDERLRQLIRADQHGHEEQYMRAREENICAYHDYKLRNKAYWYLKNLMEQQGEADAEP